MDIPQKIKNRIAFHPAVPLLGIQTSLGINRVVSGPKSWTRIRPQIRGCLTPVYKMA